MSVRGYTTMRGGAVRLQEGVAPNARAKRGARSLGPEIRLQAARYPQWQTLAQPRAAPGVGHPRPIGAHSGRLRPSLGQPQASAILGQSALTVADSGPRWPWAAPGVEPPRPIGRFKKPQLAVLASANRPLAWFQLGVAPHHRDRRVRGRGGERGVGAAEAVVLARRREVGAAPRLEVCGGRGVHHCQ